LSRGQQKQIANKTVAMPNRRICRRIARPLAPIAPGISAFIFGNSLSWTCQALLPSRRADTEKGRNPVKGAPEEIISLS
jgi:hypothetical protein